MLNLSTINRSISAFLLTVLVASRALAEVTVDVNFDVRHSVGGVDTFDREKYIVIHADATESDYNANPERLNELLLTYDAHYGRETGRMRFIGENVNEDSNRSGFANPDDVLSLGSALNDIYVNNRTSKHATEFKGRTIGAAQDRPFFPDGHLTSPLVFNDGSQATPFAYDTTDSPDDDADFGTATGEFMALMLRDAYGDGHDGLGPDGNLINGKPGAPRPAWVEVINEPFFPLIDFAQPGEEATVGEIFELHRSVAREIKSVLPDMKVGGFTNAFPNLEWRSPDSNTLFSQWDERWRRFIDEVGADMDFYSIHLYDFHSIGGGNLSNAGTPGSGVTDASREVLRKGGNIEATLDMIEHYNTIVYDEVKPWLISEYGAQLNDFYSEFWSPQRDWFILKSFNSMMIQFMERPNVIQKTVPFVLGRADFLFGNVVSDRVYPWRMLRDPDEPASIDVGNIQDSVFTEVIKFYQLWSNVKGTRVDTLSSDPDIMVDAYVDQSNSRAYLILNSLEKAQRQISLNEFGLGGASITSVTVKDLFQDIEGAPVLEETISDSAPESVTLRPEATIILEYSFDTTPTIDQSSIEEKIYATTYNQEILANEPLTFVFEGVTKADHGEAVLRLGLGRNAFMSRQPTILVNNNAVEVPFDYRGDAQLGRDVFPNGENIFFGLLEIPVPYNFLLEGENTVRVTFSDGNDINSGAVSSMALQTFAFTKEISRSTPSAQPLPDRVRQISWDNVTDLIPSDGSLPQVEKGDKLNIRVSYQTGVSGGVEEDLFYVATQVRQLDENGGIVGTSAFNLAVPGAADNQGSAVFSYVVPSTFATDANGNPTNAAIPESSQLPPGHSLLMILFMSANDNTLFANANTQIMIGDGQPPQETRTRSITFDNKDRFTPDGGTMPELGVGQTIDVDITYATGIDNFVEEDLFYVASFIRQLDENGLKVADSAFTAVVSNSADNAASTTYTFVVPQTYNDNVTPIPNSADLPMGHSFELIIFMSVDNNANFANANTAITIGMATDNGPSSDSRARSITLDNRDDLIPSGELLPRFQVGETIDITLSYATGKVAGVEEDLTYIATQLRQLDEMGAIVGTSAFTTSVPGTEPNTGTVSYQYLVPSNFATGADNSTPFTDTIPNSDELPMGHKLVLVIFMATDNMNFIDANTDIILGDLPQSQPVDDRVRSVALVNKGEFIPSGATTPRFMKGQQVALSIDYQSGAVGGVEEDLTYVAVQLRQLDEVNAIVGTSEFFVAADGNASNRGTINIDYNVPSQFSTGVDNTTPFTEPIPDTEDLASGHRLVLLVTMLTDGTNLVDDTFEIELGSVATPTQPDTDTTCFVVKAKNGNLVSFCL